MVHARDLVAERQVHHLILGLQIGKARRKAHVQFHYVMVVDVF